MRKMFINLIKRFGWLKEEVKTPYRTSDEAKPAYIIHGEPVVSDAIMRKADEIMYLNSLNDPSNNLGSDFIDEGFAVTHRVMNIPADTRVAVVADFNRTIDELDGKITS